MGLFSKVFGFAEDIFSAIGDVFSWMLGIPDEDEYEGQLLNKSSNVANIPVIYGKRLVGGTRAFVSTGGNKKNQYMYIVLALSEGEVESIDKIYVNDKIQTGSAVSGKPYKKVTTGDYKNIIWYQTFTGTESQTACTTLFNDIGGQGPDDSWTSAHKLNGVAYVAMVVRYHQDKGMTSIPEIRCEVKGRRVYNPDTGITEWSDNPALCLRDYLTNTRYGKGLPDSAIDDDAFIAAASFCATPKDSYTNGPQVNVFSLNAVIDTSKTIFKNTQKILTAMRGIMPYTEGKYSILIDKDEESVGTITSDIVTKDISIKSTSKDKKLNQAKVVFVNPYKRWEKDHVIYPAANSAEEAQFLAEDNNQILSKEITLDTVTNFYQARELARVIVLSSRSTSMMVSIICTSEALQYAVGDVIKLENESMGWTDGAEKSFRIMSMQLSVDGQVGLTLQEYDSQIYPWVVSTQEDDQPETTLPNPSFVEPVTNASATAGAQVLTDGTTQYYLDFEWDAPDDALVSEYNVEVTKKVGTVTTNNIETITTRANKARYIVTDTDAQYGFVVKAVNGASSVSDGFTVTPVATIADTTAPGDITGLSATGGLQSISLSWTNPTDADFDLVNIKVSDNNVEPANVFAQVRTNSYIYDVNSYSTTKYFWVAPVDRTGNTGSYTGPESATTGSINYSDVGNTPTIPEVATTAYLTLSDSNAPTDTEFNTAVGRDPIENDFVVVSYTVETVTNTKAYVYKTVSPAEVPDWTEVTEYIDGSMIVTGSLSASDITTGTLNANDVTISNLTIGYGSVTDTPTIPSNVSDLTNDTGFVTSVAWNELTGTAPSVTTFSGAVQQSDIDNSIDDITISGRNLVSVISMDGVATDGVYGGNKYARKLLRNNANYRIDNWDGTSTERPTGKYSLSFWAKANDSSDNPLASDLNLSVDIGDQNSTAFTINSDWKQYKIEDANVTAYLGNPYYGFIDLLVSGNVMIYVSNVKLEYGTKATEWSPAPEDVETPQWWKLTGRTNTNAPSNADFITAFKRFPVTGDILLVEDTSGNTKNYQYQNTAWSQISALINGSMLVTDSITALGAVTAGTFNLGSGNFNVDTSGVLSATGAVIDGNITAESLDVEDATVTGTLSVPIDWAGSNIGAIGASNLGESVTNLIDERVSSYTLSSAGDYKEDDAEFSASSIAYPLVIGFNHVNGTNVELSLVGSKTWTANFASPALVPDDNTLTIKLQRRTNPDGVWETIKTVNAGETGINGGDYALSYGTVYYNGIYINITHLDDPATDIYDYRAFIDNVGDNYSATVPLKLEVNEAGFTAGLSVTTGTASGGGSLSYDDNGTFTFKPADLSSYATESYVDTAVSNLVDTAPTTLNTLNELAAALGDDPNFATTTATSLGNKANKAGDTFTGAVTVQHSGTIGLSNTANGYFKVTDGNQVLAFDPNEILGSLDINIGTLSGDVDFRPSTGIVRVYNSDSTSSGDITSTTISNWNTAHGWGNHASAGYLATTLSTLDSRYGLVADSAHSVYTHSNSGTGATWTSFDFPAYNGNIGRDYYVFEVYGYEDFTKAGKFVHYTVYVNIKNAFGQPPSGNEITVQVVANLEADQNQANAGNFEFKLERDLVDGNGIPHHKLWIEADERYSALHIVAAPVYIGDFSRTFSNMFATQSTEPTTTITYPVINSASVEAPLPPSVTSTTIVGETIEIVFSESSTSDTDRYEVWSDNGGSSYSLIGVIPLTDIASSMSFIDSTFTGSGTISYRVYAVKMGAYSTPATTTKDFTLPTLDVANLQVIPDINVFSVSYDIPDSRFVDHIEIYLDTDTLSSGTSRANASLVYSGNRGSYTHNINSANRDDYHQFWVEVVEG
jgi:hypothetical protein